MRIGSDAIDKALSRFEALDADGEDRELESLANRQPHLLGLLAAACQEMGDDAEAIALDAFVRLDAMFTEALGRPVPTIPAEQVETGYERAMAQFESEIRAGEGDPVSHSAQPDLMEFVVDYVSSPIEDEDGNVAELEDEERADLIVAFRTLIQILDEAVSSVPGVRGARDGD